MKVLETDPKLSSDLLDGMIKGCEGSTILFTALDLGLFDLLEGSMSAEEISTETGTDTQRTGKFLNALVDRLVVLSMFYLFIDILGVLFIAYRNMF